MPEAVNWDREIYYKKKHQNVVAGLDEVGRGAWAGPIVAAAYCFTSAPAKNITVTDSKLLTPQQREMLHFKLHNLGSCGIGVVSAEEIDKLGLQQAQYLAYTLALNKLRVKPNIVLLDGRLWSACPYPIEAVVKGDSCVASIAAASILAKVYRDMVMETVIHIDFPEYGFDQHVGYGTEYHRQRLLEFGPSAVHRKSFKPVQAYVSS
jgi:ribonuclease HII